MILDQAVKEVKLCAERMNGMYGRVVFNEWVIVSFTGEGPSVIAYSGPRKEQFHATFGLDIEELRPGLLGHRFGPGDFEFSRYGNGTGFEAFVVLGQRIYLIWNNTGNSMEDISKDSRWLNAQTPFLQLTEVFRKDPLVLARS